MGKQKIYYKGLYYNILFINENLFLHCENKEKTIFVNYTTKDFNENKELKKIFIHLLNLENKY